MTEQRNAVSLAQRFASVSGILEGDSYTDRLTSDWSTDAGVKSNLEVSAVKKKDDQDYDPKQALKDTLEQSTDLHSALNYDLKQA